MILSSSVKRVLGAFLYLLLLILFVPCAYAQDLLVAEFNAEMHPLVNNAPEPPTKKQIVATLLKEAQFTFSGMIYGFTFTYTPADPARNVKDAFDLSPIAEIRWGDPRLSVLDTRTTKELFFARITYRPADFQRFRLRGWLSNSNVHASGEGTASYFDGPVARMSAVRDAIKLAIREYVRQRVYNRPREIRGSLALLDAPRIIVHDADYVATVHIALDISAVEPYTVF